MAQPQKNRPVTVSSPLGDGVLLFRRMTATEELGRLFEFTLELVSESDKLAFDDLLGQHITVHLELPNGQKRHFDGCVSRFSQTGTLTRYTTYQAILRPWLWFLTRTADCRIFQGKTVPEILKAVFREHGFSDFEECLSDYPPREYCVQYRETDFNFASRLMEEEGIYYFFKHADGKHTLVLSDSLSAHSPIAGDKALPFLPPTDKAVRQYGRISDWTLSCEVEPGVFALSDFDFEKPKVSLVVNASTQRKHAEAKHEMYDSPGRYVNTSDGDRYARTRNEELQAQHERAFGRGDARGLAVGGLFELTDYPRADQNREYLIVSATYQLRTEEYEPQASVETTPLYQCTFTAANSRRQFRPTRLTPCPVVQGPQTAIVVGKDGEEIWTDKYGRVKVQFHWERNGKSDETSSCWVRVAQVWAGKNWGAIHIPRMGQEVIVDFLEGDPDRPIITGRVYNADNMPPYALPANQSQSGIKSRSTKGGTPDNFNEIRFEDLKGSELLTIHAEKNQSISVEADETHTVGHDRSKTIGNDETTEVKGNRTETVRKDETITIEGNRTETVGKDETITIGANRTEDVAKEETITIGGGRTETVAKDESITIRGGRTESVTKDESITIGGGRTETVAKNEMIDIGANRTETVAKDETITISGNRTEDVSKKETVTIGGDRQLTVNKNDTVNVGKVFTLNAGDQITLTSGEASIVMKKNGDVTIKGKNFALEASGKISVKASGELSLKGSKIVEN